jgi:hypothetical protein
MLIKLGRFINVNYIWISVIKRSSLQKEHTHLLQKLIGLASSPIVLELFYGR